MLGFEPPDEFVAVSAASSAFHAPVHPDEAPSHLRQHPWLKMGLHPLSGDRPTVVVPMLAFRQYS